MDRRVVGRAARAGLLAAVLISLNACEGEGAPIAKPSTAQGAVAIFAGGCFWCVEQDFEQLDGVIEAESGYLGGHTRNPTYEQVGRGTTGHAEAVRVIYDPARISYARLVEYFWRRIDPTVKDRQFCDLGDAYRTGIYWLNEEQKKIAEASRDALLRSKRFPVIYTEVLPAGTFWMAEQYHQDYYKTNPLRYKYYRHACGRDARLKQLWGTPGTTPSTGHRRGLRGGLPRHIPGRPAGGAEPGPALAVAGARPRSWASSTGSCGCCSSACS